MKNVRIYYKLRLIDFIYFNILILFPKDVTPVDSMLFELILKFKNISTFSYLCKLINNIFTYNAHCYYKYIVCLVKIKKICKLKILIFLIK